ncbi:MAG: tRNA uridine-5-carboxymethylaminomethyl(34) synthesis GTPase MnmE [Oscillospiraceae bacterium]|nr:tRNA uridine-5-carboxymethylaminomethyl(34) synthesis GTPase MnmE [Oscillospiraceae bacterium]
MRFNIKEDDYISMINSDTITAIATPRGTGGIAIIRISGPLAFEIGEKIFRHKTKKYKSFADISPNAAVFGDIIDISKDGRVIDEGIAVKFKAPNSYTGEDTVEISCHGGIYIANSVLTAAVNAGARLAEPGEFTKTAYLNGKISLTGAEAVGRLICAVNETGARVASAQSKGGLSRKISEISDNIKNIISEIYVFIDYPGEDLTDMTPDIMLEKLILIKNQLEYLKQTYSIGRIISDGLNCAIIGKPNSGKSTLLNMLSQNNIAIVHDTPGTTRDIVYSRINTGGFVLNLFDTAGIRTSHDEIENIGIEKALSKIEECGLIIGVFDMSVNFNQDDYNILEILNREKENGKKIIVVLNKCDINSNSIPQDFAITPLIISAKNNIALNSDISARDAFIKYLEDIYKLGGYDLDSGEILTEERQYFEIYSACENITSAITALKNGFTQDIAGLDLELAAKNLDRCDSKSVSEDIVNRIFKNFCIGK